MTAEPLVLGFDTSAAHCAAALLRGTDVLAARLEEMTRGQAERLMPLLEEILSEHGVTWSDLSAIGVGIGPGNFTGIRISVSAARGLALALDIPAVGVSTFDATAHGHPLPYAATVPAPRGQMYVQTTDLGAQPQLVSEEYTTDYPRLTPPEPAVLAEKICLGAANRLDASPVRPAPLYVRAADAAPARDLPPKILP